MLAEEVVVNIATIVDILAWGNFRVCHVMAPVRNGCKGDHNRVASGNFSHRYLGHAHDDSADFENVIGGRKSNVHAHFIFFSKTVRELRAYFL